jgi:tetratricopeptide (TPR) repeat protein
MTSIEGPTKVRFLLDMADRFETDGNTSEAIKSAETALLLRRSLSADEQPLFQVTLPKQAQALVMKCNALGVAKFQKDEYDVATFLLGKALFLTDDNAKTNCFGALEHDRLRLRAASFNNLGCLEKRRGMLDASLQHLQKAVEIECLVDPDTGASPSTQMNVCTVMNKRGRHTQAAAAADRAIRNLHFQVQQGSGNFAAHGQMLMSAYYNLAVSLEMSGRPGELLRSRQAYMDCLAAGEKKCSPPQTAGNNAAAKAADAALTRLESSGILPPLIQPAGSAVQVARGTSRASSSAASSVQDFTPRPPGPSSMQVPPGARGISTAPAGAPRGSAIDKHRERIQARQKRQEESEARGQMALRRAQQAHSREKAEKQRKEQEQAAQQREELARVMYERMESGIRADRIRNLKEAAKSVQKVWRGYLVRDYLRDMAIAVVRMQAVVRSHLCRVRLHREREAKRLQAKNQELFRRKVSAASRIQRVVRSFLRKCSDKRRSRAQALRRWWSAKRIQVCFRAYLRQVEQRVAESAAAERRADMQRVALLEGAARKIQNMFRAFKSRRFMRVVRQEQTRRNAAATKIQASMRGCLTRAWFKHYKLYRRQQELSTAANLTAIIKIQRTWRMAVARIVTRRLRMERRRREHERVIFAASRKIQCAWRVHIAVCVTSGRRRAMMHRHRMASKIQCRWRVYVCRRAYIWRRDEARKIQSLRKLQRWWRAWLVTRKHTETANYHARLLAEEQARKARTACALVLQSDARYWMSARHVAVARAAYAVKRTFAVVIQAAGRGCLDRRGVKTDQQISFLVARKEEQRARETAAACVMQRSVRVFLAKEQVDLRRRQRWAAVIIQSGWRTHVARSVLRALRAKKRAEVEDVAACKIQRCVRLFFKRRELQRLEEYYMARRRHKMWEMRRVEASITIQANWRGYATRTATADARNELLQRTVHGIRIQRAWKTHVFRHTMHMEFARRQRRRDCVLASAVRIQNFWRRVLATEYVAVLRERHFNHTIASIAIQCAWRRNRAVREVARRREERQRMRVHSAAQHDAWTLCSTVVTTFLRTRQCEAAAMAMLEGYLRAALAHREMVYRTTREAAATKIQARYRGFYERQYARGVRAEAAIVEKARRAEELRRARAALRMQCAVRCFIARLAVSARRQDKRMQHVADQLERETTADPHAVVKQMFWAHEAANRRDFTAERVDRNAQQRTAAERVQRVVRVFLAVRCVARRRLAKREEEGAVVIPAQWKTHRKAHEAARDDHRRRAATQIQRIMRGVIVRRAWIARHAVLSIVQSATVREEERRDVGATRIQALWRGVSARVLCSHIRQGLLNDKNDRVRFEAARLIQKQFRRYAAVLRVARIRAEQGNAPAPPPRRRPSQQNVAPPAAPRPAGVRRPSLDAR